MLDGASNEDPDRIVDGTSIGTPLGAILGGLVRKSDGTSESTLDGKSLGEVDGISDVMSVGDIIGEVGIGVAEDASVVYWINRILLHGP